MTSSRRRLKSLEGHLTPKQAVLLWMADAHHQFETMEQYLHHLQGGPYSAWPLRRLGNQMTESVGQALKGKAKDVIHRALRMADLDVLFLYYLLIQVNGRLMEKEQYFATKALLLVIHYLL